MSHHEDLLKIVRSVRNRWRLKILLRGLALLLLGVMALLLVAGYTIDTSRFDSGTVTAARLVAYLAFAALLIRFVVWPLARRVCDEQVALYLEEREPSLGGRILSAVELGHEHMDAGASNTSAAMVERLVDSAVEECRRVEDGKRIERSALWKSSGLVAGSTLFSFALFLVGPAFLHTATPVLLNPWEKPDVANPYSIRVEPGDTTVAQGSDLEVTAAPVGFDAAELELVLRSGEGEWTRWSMLRQDEEVLFNLLVFDLRETTEYFVESSGVRSDVFTVEVRELPYVEDVHLTYHFPPYTGLDPLEQPGSGDVAALLGTEVRLAVTPTFAVPGGAVEVEVEGAGSEGAVQLPLTVGEDGRLFGSLTVSEEGTYRILLDDQKGQRLVASPDYLIDPIADQPPTLALTKPGRDIRVTNLEEVLTQVEAQDDYGVARVELIYSVNGGEEQVATLLDIPRGRKDFTGTHTLYMEEYGLQPGDLVAYYARVRDAYDGQAFHETISDIYFLEVRPFELNYRQSDQAGAMGGPRGTELSDQQRMIISATFKQARSRLSPPNEADVTTIAMSQGRLREQTLLLLEEMLEKGMFGSGSPMSTMVELLPKATEQMTLAEEALGEYQPGRALAPEQKALQYLQRMEAEFRDIQVSRQQGGGGGGEINEELADLFEMDRDQLRNQYEQVQRSRQKKVDDALDELLEKLRELARRQQQENERMRARARQLTSGETHAGSSTRSQRQLAEEAEEVARRLEKLAREESLPELAETARRLREAAEQMRRAAASSERAGEAMGSSALDQLREARRQLERGKSGRLRRDTEQAMERARHLREQQQRILNQVDRLDPADSDYAQRLRSLHEAKERMGAEVGTLETDLDQLSRDFRREQPEASRKLREASEEIRDRQIREKILYSRGVVQERSREYARNFEEHIDESLAELEARLAEAAGAIGESREQRLGRALEETREVVSALESLGERLRSGPGEGDLRQLDRELGERRRQLQGLYDRLSQEGADTQELVGVIERLDNLGLADPSGVHETLAALEDEVIQELKEFEYALRRSLGTRDDERMAEVSDDEVPDGYEEMVEKYYKALAGDAGSHTP